MKKITYFFLCIVMVFALLGCQKSDSPKSEQIKHDLSASLQSYMNYPLGIESVSIDNSITDNNTFTADAIVIATTKYSQVEFQASFSYGNHSQDWTFNGCQWNLNNYQVKNYPDDTKINQLKSTLDFDTLSPLRIEAPSVYGNEYFTSTDELSNNWSNLINAKATVYTTWRYDINTDDWYLYTQEFDEYHYSLTNNLAGQYPLYSGGGTGIMHIANVTETGFDISIDSEYYGANTFHVEFDAGYMFYDQGDYSVDYKSPAVTFHTTERATYGADDYTGEARVQFTVYDRVHNIAGTDYNMRCLVTIDGSNSFGQEWLANSQAQILAH